MPNGEGWLVLTNDDGTVKGLLMRDGSVVTAD